QGFQRERADPADHLESDLGNRGSAAGVVAVENCDRAPANLQRDSGGTPREIAAERLADYESGAVRAGDLQGARLQRPGQDVISAGRDGKVHGDFGRGSVGAPMNERVAPE